MQLLSTPLVLVAAAAFVLAGAISFKFAGAASVEFAAAVSFESRVCDGDLGSVRYVFGWQFIINWLTLHQ